MRRSSPSLWLGFLSIVVLAVMGGRAEAQSGMGWPTVSSGWPSVGTGIGHLPVRSFHKNRFVPVFVGGYYGGYYPPYGYSQPVIVYNNIYLPPPSPPPAPPAAPEVRTYRARIQVVLSDPEAQVWLDGQKSAQTGTTQLLQTPELEMGRIYSYTIKAAFTKGGQQITEERKVLIVPGTAVVLVDFTEPEKAGRRD